jgi:hypothetical protein
MRLMVRLIPALALLLALAPAFGGRAAAYETWCFDDPVILVNGQLIDIRVGMPVTDVVTMRSTTITVIIPRNVAGAVVVDDVSAFPMQTTISATGPAWSGKGSLPITVRVDVKAATPYTFTVTATPLAGLNAPLLGLLSPLTGTTSATGTANTALAMAMKLAR